MLTKTNGEPPPRLIPGKIVTMGGRDWQVPPLTLGQLQRLAPQIAKINASSEDLGTLANAVVDIVHAAVGRNYPELTRDQVKNCLLDLGNSAAVLRVAMPGSKLKRLLLGGLNSYDAWSTAAS